MRSETPLAAVAKGAVAGLVGTAVLTVAMRRGPELLHQLGLARADPGVPKTREQAEETEGGPTETLAERVAAGVLEVPIEDDTRQVAGQAIHWSYGAAWGALYGVVQSSLHLPHLVHGTIFGGLVAVVASTLVPAIGLTPPPTRQPLAMSGMQMVTHLLYGWATALTFRVLSSDA